MTDIVPDRTEPLLRLRGVERRYPVTSGALQRVVGHVHAVDGVDLDIYEGEAVGLVGESGSGKSTLGRVLLRLEPPDAGTIHFDGRDITDLSMRDLRARRSEMQLIFQDPFSSLDPRTTVAESIMEGLRAQGVGKKQRQQRLDEVLELVGLTAVAGSRVRKYSLGMRQRLGLAGVLLGEPHTVILDEPANGLDPEGIRWIRDVLTHLAGQGCAVLVSSHQLSEISLMADDLIVIGQGRLIEQCTVTDFIERHAERWVRVRSPRAGALAPLLTGAGATVAPAVGFDDDTTLDVRGISCEQVGELAAAHSVVLHELSPQTGSLEDAFLSVTAAAQEYRSAALGGGA